MEELFEIIKGVQLSNEQISKIGEKAQEEFGLSNNAKDDLMLLLLSQRKDFQNFIFEMAKKQNVK